MRLSRSLLALLAVLAMVLAGCGDGNATADDEQEPTSASDSTETASTEAAGDRVAIVVTTSILGDGVDNIVGEDASVEVLMGPGVDPHAFSASAAQAQSVREADLVVANGLHLEESLLDVLESAEEDGANVLRVGEELDPIPFDEDEGHDHEGEEDHDGEEGHEGHEGEEGETEHDHDGEEGHEGEESHSHGEFDPHVWFDPERMADGATIIAGAVAEVDDNLDDAEWEQRGQAYADELMAMDEEITETLSVVTDDQRQLVTNHDSFGYFAARYDFEVVGTVIPGSSTQVDTSAESFVALADVIVDEDVPAIFSETTSSDRLAEALASEIGRDVEIVQLYSGALGEPGSGAETYVDMMRFNADAIAGALG